MRTLFAAVILSVVSSCGAGQVGGFEAQDESSLSADRLVVEGCIEAQVAAFANTSIDDAQLNGELDACLVEAGLSQSALSSNNSQSCSTSNNNGVCTIKKCSNGVCTTSTASADQCKCNNSSGGGNGAGGNGGGGNGGGGNGGGSKGDYRNIGRACGSASDCGSSLSCYSPYTGLGKYCLPRR
jgi:hypothetical protein